MKLYYWIGLVLLLAGNSVLAEVRNEKSGPVRVTLNVLPSMELIAGNLLGIREEAAIYKAMLGSYDHEVQRLAAKKIHQARIRDTEVLDLVAKRLDELYLQEALHPKSQDAAAWFCRALGQSGIKKYAEQLAIVANSTRYPKIKKYAQAHAAKGITTVVTLESLASVKEEEILDAKIEGTYQAQVTTNSLYVFKRRSHRNFKIEFTQEGNEVVGVSEKLDLKVIGKIKGNVIDFYAPASKAFQSALDGQWKVVSSDGASLTGKWTLGSSSGKWDLKKIQ